MMVEIIKGDTDWDGSFTTMVQGDCFCFNSGGHDVAKCNAFSKNGPVGRRLKHEHVGRCVVVEIEFARAMAPCFGKDNICRI